MCFTNLVFCKNLLRKEKVKRSAETSRMPNVKVHQSAICIIPPKNIWSQIQAIRAVHDKSYIRWMPHINLMYPFYEDVGSNFEKAGQSAAEALKNIQPFEVRN